MQNKVKWTISILLVFIAILFLAIPKLIGIVIHDTIADQVFGQINTSTEGQITITDPQLETGWFRSKIQFNIVISDTQNRVEPYYLLLQGIISHGPILFAPSEFALGLVSIHVTVNADKLESKVATITTDDMETSVVVKFDQSLSIRAKVQNISIRNSEENLYTTIDDLDAYMDIKEDLSARADIKSSKILIQNNQSDIRLTASDPSLHLETAKLDDVSAASAIELKIPSTVASEPLSFNVSNAILEWRSYSSNKSAELTDFSQYMQAKKIESNLPLESFIWKSEMRGVTEELIRSYNEMLFNIQSASSIDPILRMAELTQIANKTGLLLLQNEINFTNIIEANFYQGMHKLDVNVLWGGLPALPSIDSLMFKDAAEALNVEVNLLLDQESVSLSPFAELAELYSSQNYLMSSNDELTLDAKLTKGIVTLNGESFPLDQLLQ